MKVQVLASVLNQNMEEIVKKMNISTDAVIINQCDELGYEEMEWKGKRISYYSFPQRGVGRSRNEGILRAKCDICLFSDEDIVYEPDYGEKIAEEFCKNPKADMILFQIEVEESRRTYEITERKKVHWYNCGRYGAVSFAIRYDRLLESGVMFSLLFGGGARFSNGEDSLFLKELIQKGYRVYTAPVVIGREEARESSWFEGYHRKFFYDRGVLYHYLYGKLALVMALRFLIVRRKIVCGKISAREAFTIMREGIGRAR